MNGKRGLTARRRSRAPLIGEGIWRKYKSYRTYKTYKTEMPTRTANTHQAAGRPSLAHRAKN